MVMVLVQARGQELPAGVAKRFIRKTKEAEEEDQGRCP